MAALPQAVTPDNFRSRMRRGLDRRAFAIVGFLALLVSTQLLFHPHLFELWHPADIAQAWAEYFAEVATIGTALLVAVVAAESLALPSRAARAALLVGALTLPALVVVALIGRWQSGVWLAAPLALAGEASKFSLLGAFVLGARGLQRRALRADDAARALEAGRRDLERQADEAQLQLLQAQIEPHFLFNTLATVRRLYRKQPAAGAQAIDSLLVYLRAALPRVRRSESTLGDEFDLVEAYLQLFRLRMGARLRFTVELAPELRMLPFPPMVLVTLAENAIKHGLAPTELGGSIRVAARRAGAVVEVEVVDDGIGFGPSAGGQGVGLVNTRRQLAARWGDAAALRLEAIATGGVRARVVIPATPVSAATVAIRTPGVGAAR